MLIGYSLSYKSICSLKNNLPKCQFKKQQSICSLHYAKLFGRQNLFLSHFYLLNVHHTDSGVLTGFLIYLYLTIDCFDFLL